MSHTAGEIPTPVRQDDKTGIIGSLFDQAGGDDIRHDPLKVGALDACARTYSTDAPPRCGIASAHVMKAITNFVASAGRSSLGIIPAHWPKSGSFLGVGKGIDGYLDRPTGQRSCAFSKPLGAEAATASRGTAALRVHAKVAVHPVEQGVIDVGLGCAFARRSMLTFGTVMT